MFSNSFAIYVFKGAKPSDFMHERTARISTYFPLALISRKEELLHSDLRREEKNRDTKIREFLFDNDTEKIVFFEVFSPKLNLK